MPLYLPTLSHWEHGNHFSGSLGRASWHAAVREAGEDGGKELYVEAWTWPPCYEQATPERTAGFPLTQEGLDGMRAWLEKNLPEIAEAGG